MSDGPQGVQLVRADGTVIDCELVDQGVDDEGMHNWMIANAEFHPENGDRIHVDVLPARTGITFLAPGLRRE